jgi:DedD protein
VAKADDGKRARAALEGDAAAAAPAPVPAKGGRYVVQVGAYADPAMLHEARQKVEKLGLKTYTQVIEGDAGKRTRVRVGPFASREEASSAAARVKGAGLPANVVTL